MSWIPWVVLLLSSAVVATLIVVIAPHWPYSEGMLVPVLQDTFKANVTIQLALKDSFRFLRL